MNSLYDRVSFLELFDNERIIDQEAKIYEYTLNFNDNIFTLHISCYDQYASIMLQDKKSKIWTFDIGIDWIDEIKIEQEKTFTYLSFYKEGTQKPILRVMVKPVVSLQYHIYRNYNNKSSPND